MGDFKVKENKVETYPNKGVCCSNCLTGFKKDELMYTDYCPHCGAKMDGGENNNAKT